jgi:uncharacterized membrane protein YciS (DUF1049 family)
MVFTIIMALTAIYTYRTSSQLSLSAYIATAFAGGVAFEWVFDSRFYFRCSIDNSFIAL